LVKKYTAQTYFAFFSKLVFYAKCQFMSRTYKPLLISSDRAELFIKNTLKYPLEVKSAVLIFDSPTRIYRILKVKKLVLAKTMWYFFFIKKEENEIFGKAQNYLWYIVVDISKKIFSQIGHDLKRFSCGKMRTTENQSFSLKTHEDGL
jgi:hypothetical protein